MSAWNAMTYEGKDTILQVVRDEAERMFAMAEAPGAWEAPTACSDWQVRDIIGHLVDTTEGYFKSFETARAGGSAEARGLPVMHELAGDGGRAFRGVPQAEMMGRIRSDLDKMIWSVAEQIAKLSEAFELKAGDIIYSGTPENVGAVVKGDVLLCKLEGLPDMSIRIT